MATAEGDGYGYFWDALLLLLDEMPEAPEAELGAAPKTWERRTFSGRGGAYLTRYTLYVAKPRRGKDGKARSPWALHVNVFHRSDEDEETHSHPWPCGSLMLDGGYREERESSDAKRKVKYVMPGDFNWLPHGTFHRVDLLSDRAITLFWTGRKLSSWTFLKLASMVPWKQFVEAKGLRTRDG